MVWPLVYSLALPGTKNNSFEGTGDWALRCGRGDPEEEVGVDEVDRRGRRGFSPVVHTPLHVSQTIPHPPRPKRLPPKLPLTPILSGFVIPFAILLEIPGLTEHWYIRTVDDKIVESRMNPAILVIGMAISMGIGLLANICLVLRFLERRRADTQTTVPRHHSHCIDVLRRARSTRPFIFTPAVVHQRTLFQRRNHRNGWPRRHHPEDDRGARVRMLLRCFRRAERRSGRGSDAGHGPGSLRSGVSQTHARRGCETTRTAETSAGASTVAGRHYVASEQNGTAGLGEWRRVVTPKQGDGLVASDVGEWSAESRWACLLYYDSHRHGMHLNLEVLTGAQLESAALEAGVPLSTLLPPDFKPRRGLAGDNGEKNPKRAEGGSSDMPLTHTRIGRMVGMLGSLQTPCTTRGGWQAISHLSSPYTRITPLTSGGEARFESFKVEMEKEEEKAFYASLTVAWTLFLAFWIAGSAIFHATEGWPLGSTMYFCMSCSSMTARSYR
ncbi:Tandem pore domain k+ channel [Salix suchowensis]|nr:Tandem pore domain k+ channel [Salix suchowensis]